MKSNKKINLKKIALCLCVGLMVLVGLVACLVLWRGSTKDIEGWRIVLGRLMGGSRLSIK